MNEMIAHLNTLIPQLKYLFLPINPTAEFGFEVEKHRARDFVELIPDLSITRFLFISFLVFCVSKTLRVFF